MKKSMFWLFAFFLFLLIPSEILGCSINDRDRLQKFANNVSISLEEFIKNDKHQMRITFAGVSKEIIIFDENTYVDLENYSNNAISEINLENLKIGKTNRYKVKGNDVCSNYVFRTITVNVPKYNQYYDDPLCEKAKSYSLCQKWYDSSDISYERFEAGVNNYINENQKNEIRVPQNDDDYYEAFLKIYEKYYLPTLIITISVFTILMVLWVRQNKKNKL